VKILMVHNRYLERGGEDESTELEVALLRARGHEVVEYTEDNHRIPTMNSLALAGRTLWSAEAYRQIRRLIGAEGPDVMHVQNWFPLISPAVYYAAQRAGVPVVQSLRNYRLLCPNASFFRDGRVCELCLGRAIPWPGVRYRCYRDSRLASTGVAGMLTVHNGLATWTRQVDIYVALSAFARAKFIEGRLPADRVVVKPNFVHPDPGVGAGDGQYALFIGRLSPEKGVESLVSAWEQRHDLMPLKVVGGGPMADLVTAASARIPNLEYLGRVPLKETYRLLARASCAIVPSTWYEPFGRVVVEAFACGTPVLAARAGALTEQVDEGRTGLHFTPGSPDDLAAKVHWAATHPAELHRMRVAARSEFEAKYTSDRNYDLLLSVYETAIARRANQKSATLRAPAPE
jgi:glycosyltransferase involved in cell wall biosynthesis